MIEDPQVRSASELLVKRLGEYADKNNLPCQASALARHTGIREGTLAGYIRRGRLPDPTNLELLRTKITTITKEDAKILGIASSRNVSLSRKKALENRWASKTGKQNKNGGNGARHSPAHAKPQPLPSVHGESEDARVGSLVRELFHLLELGGNAKDSAAEQLASIFSQDTSPYTIGDMPAVLTKENFREIDASNLPAEEKDKLVAYANRAFEEARKCLVLLAQLTPTDIKEEMLARLQANATLLWRTYKVAKCVAPAELVQDIDLARLCESSLPKQPQVPTGG